MPTFLDAYAPDPVTRQVVRLARTDEARHVAFEVVHLEHQAQLDPSSGGKLRAALEGRRGLMADNSGLDRADATVSALYRDIDEECRQQLVRPGLSHKRAAEISSFNTKNFM